MNAKTAGMLFFAAGIAVSACGSSTNGATTGATGGSVTAGDGTGGSSGGGLSTTGGQVYWSIGSGTIGGSAAASVTDLEVFFQGLPGQPPFLILQAQPLSDGGDNIVVTKPTGVTGQLSCAIQLDDGPPSVKTYTSTTECGAIVFSYSSTTLPEADVYTANGPTISPCQLDTAESGSWTLKLTSVTLIVDGGLSPPVESLYLPHGTLSATMVDPANANAMLNLTF